MVGGTRPAVAARLALPISHPKQVPLSRAAGFAAGTAAFELQLASQHSRPRCGMGAGRLARRGTAATAVRFGTVVRGHAWRDRLAAFRAGRLDPRRRGGAWRPALSARFRPCASGGDGNHARLLLAVGGYL